MLFNSVDFLLFFPLVTAGYFLISPRWRWLWILAASCYFYMVFRPVYILILAFTILVDYFAGIKIAASTGRERRLWLIASILANTGVLAVFKYYNFLNATARDLAIPLGINWSIPDLGMLLPIGLSFHTFQSLSYTIEVYRGHQPVERNLGIFALYVMYYPQLVAGPIERPQNMLHQFHEQQRFSVDNLRQGLLLMGWGLLKKVCVADRLAPAVDTVYDAPTGWPGISYIIATVFFAVQIYCDFSGYSDVALGSAQVMGHRLMKNFDTPYFSTSVGEFWRRWHISLSTWFRDYVYIPLGGSRSPGVRRYANLMITFLVSGLWHGANWTYMIWGGLNGLYLVVEQLSGWAPSSQKDRQQTRHSLLTRAAGMVSTFCCISFAWIFFRAKSLSEALMIAGNLGRDLLALPSHLSDLPYIRANIMLNRTKADFVAAIVAIAGLFLVEAVLRRTGGFTRFAELPRPLRWGFYYAILAGIAFFGAFNSARQFIYFQF
jgi:alginate O-acetyltransferase complex protein AlgI